MNFGDNFTKEEFACKGSSCCGHSCDIKQSVLDNVNKLRERLGEPLNISSGYRCPTHNRIVGGEEGSYHTKGLAVDVWIGSENYTTEEIASIAIECGFDTAVAYPSQGFVHCDMRGYRAFW